MLFEPSEEDGYSVHATRRGIITDPIVLSLEPHEELIQVVHATWRTHGTSKNHISQYKHNFKGLLLEIRLPTVPKQFLGDF